MMLLQSIILPKGHRVFVLCMKTARLARGSEKPMSEETRKQGFKSLRERETPRLIDDVIEVSQKLCGGSRVVKGV